MGALITYGEGGIRKASGQWQCFVTYTEHGSSQVKTKTKMTGISCGNGNSGKVRARKLMVEWRDGLVAEEAVRSFRMHSPESPEGLIASVNKALGVNDVALNMPFDLYAARYVAMSSKSADGVVGGAMQGGNADILRLWILKYLPDPKVAVREMMPDMIHEMLRGLSENGYSASVILKAFGLLRCILDYAVNVDGLRPNPCYGIRKVKKRKPRVNFMGIRDADRLAASLAVMPATATVFAGRMALACGICEGEVSGLRAQMVHTDERWLDITQVVARRRMPDGKTRYVLCRPKTDGRDRRIPINDEMLRAIEDRVAYLRQECSQAGRRYSDDLFLTGRPDGSWTAPSNLGKSWRVLSESMGLTGRLGQRVTFHDLRHTFATSFLAKGGSTSDLMAILGHSTAYMTLEVYAGSDPEVRLGAMEQAGRTIPEPVQNPCGLVVPLNELFEFSYV